MQFSTIVMTLAAATATVAAPTEGNFDCKSPTNPCNTYGQQPHCSVAWTTDIKACIAGGACGIRWIQDPLKECPSCSAPEHPCNEYKTHPPCTTAWVDGLKKCEAAGACGVRWFQDPLKVCNVKDSDCSNQYHDCNLYTKEVHCSDAWKQRLTHCEAVGACGIRWFQDPLNECKATQ